MGTLKLKYIQKRGAAPDEFWLPQKAFKKFNPSLLGLGNISKPGETFEGIAAIFDLQAFTPFCNQRNAHLVVPEYLNKFTAWLFERISQEALNREDGQQFVLWYKLPFFAKFLGDGVLFLWDDRNFTAEARINIVDFFEVICNDFEKYFLLRIRKRFTKPPLKLRCGIARGQITSIGNGSDFVGPCINVASRLQKLGDGQFSFAFTKEGLNSESKTFRLIKIHIRGMPNPELVYVRKKEFKALSKAEQKMLLPQYSTAHA